MNLFIQIVNEMKKKKWEEKWASEYFWVKWAYELRENEPLTATKRRKKNDDKFL